MALSLGGCAVSERRKKGGFRASLQGLVLWAGPIEVPQ